MRITVLVLFLSLLLPTWAQTPLDWTVPFSVDGIQLGFTRQQVLKQLGAPREQVEQTWKYKDLTVTFRQDQVYRLYGSVLRQKDRTLVQAGELSGVVRRHLGEPASNQVQGDMDVMLYQSESLTVGVFSKSGRVSVVGLGRKD